MRLEKSDSPPVRVKNSSIGAHVTLNRPVPRVQCFENTPSVELDLLIVTAVPNTPSRSGVSPPLLLFPISVGRSSFPVPAAEYDFPVACDDYNQLLFAHVSLVASTLGKLSAQCALREARLFSWSYAFEVQKRRTAQVLVSTPLSKMNETVFDQLSVGVASLFGGSKSSLLCFAAELYLYTAQLEVPLSHPLVRYLDEVLRGYGVLLVESVSGAGMQWSDRVESLLSAWFKGNGQCVRVEELYASALNCLKLTDGESLNFLLEEVGCRDDSSDEYNRGLFAVDTIIQAFERFRTRFDSAAVSDRILSRNHSRMSLENSFLQYKLMQALEKFYVAIDLESKFALNKLRLEMLDLLRPVILSVRSSKQQRVEEEHLKKSAPHYTEQQQQVQYSQHTFL